MFNRHYQLLLYSENELYNQNWVFPGPYGHEKETGFDLNEANSKVILVVSDVKNKGGDVIHRFRFELLPGFVDWNKLDHWKDVKNWEPKRIGALVLYVCVVIISFQRVYMAFKAPRIAQIKQDLIEAYMEAVIPEPSPTNIKRAVAGVATREATTMREMKMIFEISALKLGMFAFRVQRDSYVHSQLICRLMWLSHALESQIMVGSSHRKE
ncbi:ATP-dependent zinc metalloprotease FTSH 12, chloroplastic-like [Papaver somniferum]|uniref:ATP-dependent zinc metalloprotease FTSH 12, chloroplastic-like n=1 Tax=Papaver somniferum TaxID=3469 RepID=UPI000E700928|nr:ATP-dependent zinc metalloprotease FTSH 12, chloroplastic-like [Papaver somniferum]